MAGAGHLLGRAGSLVGRDAELGVITDLIARVPTQSAAIELVGAAGIGKTTLLVAAADHAGAGGQRVLWMRATEAESAMPWAGMVSLYPSLPAGTVDALVEVQRAAVLAAVGEAAPTVASAGPYVAAALRNLLASLSADEPLLLVVDDLQWLDPATAAAVAVAVRGLAESPLTVLAASREGLAPRIELDRLVTHAYHRVLPAALDESHVHELLRQRVGRRLTQTMVTRVARLSGGNPLYASLLADHVAAGGAVDELPRSIIGSYLRQIEALPPATVDVLEHAAVLGRPDLAILAAACSDRDVTAELVGAARSGLVTGRGDALQFVHPLVPAALLERLGRRGRDRIHRTLALVVDDPELCAVHLAAAATTPDAPVADALEQAAHGALARGARIEAGQRFERSAELTPPDALHARWRRALAAGDAYLGGGDLERAAHHASVADALADGPVATALAGGLLVQVVASRDGLHSAHDLVCDLLDRLEGQPVLRSFLARARARIEQTFDLEAALETAICSQAELAAADEPRAAELASVMAENCRFVLGLPTDPIAAWELVRPDADPTDHLSAGWLAVEMLVWDHRVGPALAALDQFQQVSDERGNMLVQFKVNDFRAGLEARRGNLAIAERELRRAVDAAELTGYPASMAGSGLARIMAFTGRHDEAATMLASVEEPAEDLPLLQVARHVGYGFAALAASRWSEAVEHLQAAWNAAEKMGMGDLRALPFRPDLVEALTRVGRVADAANCATRIEELADRCGAAPARLQAGRARLHVLIAEGRFHDAVELGERVAAESERLRLPTERCRTLLALGTALRRSGRRKDATSTLADARAVAVELGLVPWIVRIDEELARLVGRRDPYQLTSTETRVAELVARGRTNREVASELYVSLRTVESNLTRIYRKLGIRSRAELAAGYRPSVEAGPR